MAFEQPPPEGEYLGRMPAPFKMIAALLGDLDNSDGRGAVFFRRDGGPEALRRAGQHVRRAFPGSAEAEPVGAFVVTWEKMAAAGAGGLDAEVRRRWEDTTTPSAPQTFDSCAPPSEEHLPAGGGVLRKLLPRHPPLPPAGPAVPDHAHRGQEQRPPDGLQRGPGGELVLDQPGDLLPLQQRGRGLRQEPSSVRPRDVISWWWWWWLLPWRPVRRL